MSGRKRIKLEKKRYGDCVVIERTAYVGNNLQYRCQCDCGEIFTSSAQQLKSGLTLKCPKCRKRETWDARAVNELKKINIHAVKYTLMNTERTSIIQGANGIHSYFCKAKARTAAKVMGAVVVPLSEARAIQNTSI